MRERASAWTDSFIGSSCGEVGAGLLENFSGNRGLFFWQPVDQVVIQQKKYYFYFKVSATKFAIDSVNFITFFLRKSLILIASFGTI